MRPQLSMSLFLIAAACGSSSHSNPDATKNPDAKVWMDAPPNVPAMITISGTAEAQSQGNNMPLAGAAVAIYKRSDETTALGTATTDAQGKYSIQIPTGSMVVDGYVKTTKATYADNYDFPTKPWEANTTANPQMISSGNLGGLKALLGSIGKELVVINLTDSGGQAVQGASIATDPAAPHYAYMNGSGIPDSSLTMTNTDGIAFAAGVDPGTVMINGNKTGAVFKGHSVLVHANSFTTTSVTE